MRKQTETGITATRYLGEAGRRSGHALDSSLIRSISDYVAANLAVTTAFRHQEAAYYRMAEEEKCRRFPLFRRTRHKKAGTASKAEAELTPTEPCNFDFGSGRKADTSSPFEAFEDDVDFDDAAAEEELPDEEENGTAIFSPIIDEPGDNEPFPAFSDEREPRAMYSLEEEDTEEKLSSGYSGPRYSIQYTAPKEDGRIMFSREDTFQAPGDRIAERISRMDRSFGETLLTLIEEKQMKNSEFYNRANISKQLFHRITTQTDRPPKKNIALACAVALKLDLEETKSLLEKAGYALSPADVTDVIVEAFISAKHYDIFDINEYLYKYERGLLGSSMN